MILVTVGTSSFDTLIKKVDELIEEGRIAHPVTAQIGEGKYIPQHMRYFRFAGNFKEGLLKARVVVTCGGAGTIFECLEMQKLIIGIDNPTVSDGHQSELLEKMHNESYLYWCKDLDNLPKVIDAYVNNFSGPVRIWNTPKYLDLNEVLEEIFKE